MIESRAPGFVEIVDWEARVSVCSCGKEEQSGIWGGGCCGDGRKVLTGVVGVGWSGGSTGVGYEAGRRLQSGGDGDVGGGIGARMRKRSWFSGGLKRWWRVERERCCFGIWTEDIWDWVSGPGREWSGPSSRSLNTTKANPIDTKITISSLNPQPRPYLNSVSFM